MQAMTCPQCGAPAQVAPGQSTYECPYCHRQFATNVREPPQPQAHTFIIVQGRDDDGDDDEHHRPFVHAAPSGMSWLRWVAIAVLVSALGGGGVLAWFSKHSAIASALVWDGTAPFRCDGNEQVSVTGVNAQLSAGTAITVEGNCHFTCTDCTIKAPTAIETSSNGSVTIVNGSVIGTDTMVDATGNSRVTISGNVTASGEVKKSTNAKVSVPKPAAPAATAKPAPRKK